MNERILVLGDVVGLRNGDRWFSVKDLSWIFEALRLPSPSNLSRSLGQLHSMDLVTRRSTDDRWALTPTGRHQVVQLVGEADYNRVAAELAGTPGVEYAHARHTVIPPSFAPARWQAGIARLLDRYPFESNVFCMTRFPKAGKIELADPLQAVIDALRNVVAQHGMQLHLASDRQLDDDLLSNVGAYMWACQYGVGLLENLRDRAEGLNDNMLIELGSMLVTGRRCAILKDNAAPGPPSDLSGQIYKSVNFSDVGSVEVQVHGWLSEDLALGRCPACPPLSSTSRDSTI